MKYFTKTARTKIPTKKEEIDRELKRSVEYYNKKPYGSLAIGAGTGTTIQLLRNAQHFPMNLKQIYKKVPAAAAVGALAGGTLYALGRPRVQRRYENPEEVKKETEKWYDVLSKVTREEIEKEESRLNPKIRAAEMLANPKKADRLRRRLEGRKEEIIGKYFNTEYE